MAKRPGPPRRKKKSRRGTESGRMRGIKIDSADLDYKNVALLQRLTSAQGKLFSRKRTGLSAEQQRQAARALKRARQMALMPFVN